MDTMSLVNQMSCTCETLFRLDCVGRSQAGGSSTAPDCCRITESHAALSQESAAGSISNRCTLSANKIWWDWSFDCHSLSVPPLCRLHDTHTCWNRCILDLLLLKDALLSGVWLLVYQVVQFDYPVSVIMSYEYSSHFSLSWYVIFCYCIRSHFWNIWISVAVTSFAGMHLYYPSQGGIFKFSYKRAM